MPSRPWRAPRANLALVALCGACVDPAGTFDDFVERDRAARPMEPDAAPTDAGQPDPDSGAFVLPTPEQIRGTYLSVVSTVISPLKPVVSLLEIEAEVVEEGLALRQRDRPLSAADRRTPVGEFNAFRTVVVPSSGEYFDEREGVVTPQAANAVLPAETIADLVFRASLEGAEFDPVTGQVLFFCGTVDGMLITPLAQSLTGSTFTTVRITDPERYPAVLINCAKQPAEPLP